MKAEIVRGKKTNRVRVEAAPRIRKPRVPKRFRKDLSTRGRPYRILCISIPRDELAAIDDAADSVLMARSHFLREAARRFREQLSTKKGDQGT